MLLFLVCVSSTGVALASREALPGDNLYRVKLGLEQGRLALTFGPEQRAAFHTELAQQRLIEIQSLILEGNLEPLEGAVQGFERQLSRTLNAIQVVAVRNPEEARRRASDLRDTLSRQPMLMSVLAAMLPTEYQPLFQRLLAVTDEGILAADNIVILTLDPRQQTATAGAGSAATGTATPLPSGTPTPPPSSTATAPATTAPATTPTVGTQEVGPDQTPAASEPVISGPGQPTQPPQELEPTQKPDPTSEPKPTKEPQPTKKPKPTKQPPPDDPPPDDPDDGDNPGGGNTKPKKK